MSKTKVAILGATGAVGQRFVQLLVDHPWFEVAEVVASDRSAGKPYREACTWRLPGGMPDVVGDLVVKGLDAPLQSRLLRRTGGGYIVTNPNCSVVGLAMAVGPLHHAFGVEAVAVVTLQALSGAGYPGVASMDIGDNVIPFIGGGEEEKIESEPQKILGDYEGGSFRPAQIVISSSVHRVAVSDGHTLAAFVKLRTKASPAQAAAVLAGFKGEPQERGLPFAPRNPIHVLVDDNRPQPRLDRDRERGMAVSVGRLREDHLFDLRLEALVHNTIRGAAGAAILNAELLSARSLLPS